MRVIIIGGGIGGLCLAHGLKRAGIEVDVFERQPSPTENLAGFGIHIDRVGRRALRNCVPLSDWTTIQSLFRTSGSKLFFRDTNFRLLAERDDVQLTQKPVCEVDRSGIGRVELRDALLSGLQNDGSPAVHCNKAFESYTRLDNGRVRVHFVDGTSEDGDLVVGADGANSHVRQQYLPEIKRLDLGISAIAGRTIIDDELARDLPSELTDGSLNNIVPRSKGWMFASAWKSKQSSDVDSEAEHYVLWAYVVPQVNDLQGISEESSLRDLVLEAIHNWAPELQNLVRRSSTSTIKCLNIRSMPTLTPWSPSNVTVMGDAIHNMTPMGGIGANTALRDAELLTRVIIDVAAGRTILEEAIGIYEQEMRAYANEAVGLSRKNAENACNGGGLQRLLLRGLLCAAQASPAIMRAAFGRTAMEH